MSNIDFNWLKEHLSYNQETGIFTWIKKPAHAVKVGTIAGRHRPDGYIAIQVKSRIYLAHRLAWFFVYQQWPSDQIDHINGTRNDNRFCNLREATRKQNMENRKPNFNSVSGYVGVTWSKQHQRWCVRIMSNKKPFHIGYFNCLLNAVIARKKAEQSMFTHHCH